MAPRSNCKSYLKLSLVSTSIAIYPVIDMAKRVCR